MSSVEDTVIERESLRQLLGAALREFPDREHGRRIRSYVEELSHLMDTAPSDVLAPSAARARATAEATGEDVLTLLCKLEDYLESLLVERQAAR